MRLTRLILLAAILAWFVVGLGAYVRLSDAGLGCPDWPGCYGRLGAPDSELALQAARVAFPGRPVEVEKAWKEMVHRYAAGFLGLAVLAVFILAWRENGRSARPAAALLGLVAAQALLGRLTVSELLRPAVVTAHLLGGMATLALLAWLWASRRAAPRGTATGLRWWAAAGLALAALQIALGGWTSSHYAALVCGTGLSCRGAWLPGMDFAAAFEPGTDAMSSLEALTAIHWSHRLGAMAVSAVLLPLALRLLREDGLRRFGWLLLALLTAQLALGAANVALALPLASAVLHNAVAALLLAALVVLNRSMGRMR